MTTLAFDLKGKIDPRIKKTINCGHLLNFFFFSFIWFLLYCIARVPSYIVCKDNTTISCRSRYIRINIDITEDCRWALGCTGRKFEYETVR